jgi:hypothetical protein
MGCMGHSAALTNAALLALACLRLQEVAAFPDPATLRDPQQKPVVSEPQGKPETSNPRPPLPPKPIAGISGFESVSTLLYPAALDRPHELRATYVFPERVRWQLSVKDGKGDERILQFRSGETVYRILPNSAASETCTGTDRSETLLHMEMRRALMLYPDGFEWKGMGPERRADLGELGTLFVLDSIAPDKRPTELGDAGPDGKTIDSFKAIRWREKDGRTWPAEMELWHAGELAWKETVESVDVRGRFVDSYFIPPDRRDRTGAEPMQGSIRDLDLPPTCALRVETSKGMTWDGALADLARLRGEWSKQLAEKKLELEPIATIEISEEGEPTAIVLRLSTAPDAPPAGFLLSGPRKGLATAVLGLKEATSAKITDLRRALPKGSVEGTPYVRFDPKTGAEGRIVVVLPYSKVR